MRKKMMGVLLAATMAFGLIACGSEAETPVAEEAALEEEAVAKEAAAEEAPGDDKIVIGFANIAGVFGFKPPTKDVNVTASLAIMSIILIEAASIRRKGPVGFLKSFAHPTPVMVPINLMELVTRPLSLCMRLFGNVLGAFVIMKLVEILLFPLGLPPIFGLYFDFFDGFIQAYIFVFLTGQFIREAIE